MSSTIMTGSAVPSPSSIDPRQLQGSTLDRSQSSYAMNAWPQDAGFLSSHLARRHESNSPSASDIDTPAHLTSENSIQSNFSDYAMGDPFFGVDFDGPGHDLWEGDGGGGPAPFGDDLSLGGDTPGTPATNADGAMISTDQADLARGLESSRGVADIDIHLPRRSDGLYSASTPSTTSFNPAKQQMTPDISIHSSHTSAEGTTTSINPLPEHSPRVTLTTWNSTEAQDLSANTEDNTSTHEVTSSHGGAPNLGSYHVPTSETHQTRTDFGTSYDDTMGGGAGIRSGVHPTRRKSISDIEIPNFKDQARNEEIAATMRDVEEWRSQAVESTDLGNEAPPQLHTTLQAPISNRSRSLSTGAISTKPRAGHDFGGISHEGFPGTTGRNDASDEGGSVRSLSPTPSIHRNRLVEGQVYYNTTTAVFTQKDIELMKQSRHFHDGPAFPHITEPILGGERPTANEEIEKWNRKADALSLLSRSATWGTRRRSEPSIYDIESVTSGGLLKRLSFGKGPEKKPGIFLQLNNTIGNIVRKKSVGESNKLKRNRSSAAERSQPAASPLGINAGAGSLAPPPRSPNSNRVRPQSPRLQTTFGNELTPGEIGGHHRRASVGGASPKAAIGGFFNNMSNSLRRNRSRSDLGGESGLTGLASQWKKMGGPPVPNLTSPKVELHDNDITLRDISDAEVDDDDEDDQADDGEFAFDWETPIVATPDGFREHIRRLYPTLEPGYLLDRLAHQQVVRYKSLLNLRVKHSVALRNRTCISAEHCLSMGGSIKYFEAKTRGRSNLARSGQIDGDSSDSNPENKLGADSFPPGVPSPPAQTLPAEFECQLCFRVKRFSKPSDWTKHVHEDVQPFTCTYVNCKDAKSFKRKADWVRHENERHRHLEWWTCEIDDCNHRCYRKDNFLQHLVREHKLPEPTLKSKAAIKKAKGAEEEVWRIVRQSRHSTTVMPSEEPCKFCGKTFNSWKKLTVHLGKHMEHISLPILRVVEQISVDANTIISPVDALSIRQQPATPLSMNRQRSSGTSGYQSNTISPYTEPFSYIEQQEFSQHHNPRASAPISGENFREDLFWPTFGSNTTGVSSAGYSISQAVTGQQTQAWQPRPEDTLGSFTSDGFYGLSGANSQHNSHFPSGYSPHINQSAALTSAISSLGAHAQGHQPYGSMTVSHASSVSGLSPSTSGHPGTSHNNTFLSASTSRPVPAATDTYTSAPTLVLNHQNGQHKLGNNGRNNSHNPTQDRGISGQLGPAIDMKMEMKPSLGFEYGQMPNHPSAQQGQIGQYISNIPHGQQQLPPGMGVGVAMGRNRSSSGANGGTSGYNQAQAQSPFIKGDFSMGGSYDGYVEQ